MKSEHCTSFSEEVKDVGVLHDAGGQNSRCQLSGFSGCQPPLNKEEEDGFANEENLNFPHPAVC